MAKVVTANILATGIVVFLTEDGQWVCDIARASSFEDANDAESALAQAKDDERRAIVVDPFLADMGPESNGRPKMTLRDTIRAYGPTISYLPTAPKVA